MEEHSEEKKENTLEKHCSSKETLCCDPEGMLWPWRNVVVLEELCGHGGTLWIWGNIVWCTVCLWPYLIRLESRVTTRPSVHHRNIQKISTFTCQTCSSDTETVIRALAVFCGWQRHTQSPEGGGSREERALGKNVPCRYQPESSWEKKPQKYPDSGSDSIRVRRSHPERHTQWQRAQ